MVVCPRCSYENKDSAMNCASCHINLQWALENPQEAVPHDRGSMGGSPSEPQAENRVVRGLLVAALLLAIPASGFLAFLFAVIAGWSARSDRSGYMAVAWFWLVVALVGIPAALVRLYRRGLKDIILRVLQIMALIGVTGGLLFGLMRLTLVILPERTGQSLINQYKLGERDFRGATLEGADLREADLRKASLSRADLREANLSEASLYKSDLRGAYLSEADLTRAYLSSADLTGADLHEANLCEVDLRGANLTGANLFRANLREADLTGANLEGADLREADLSKASLRGAVLDDATQIDAKWRLVNGILSFGAEDRDLAHADLRGAYLCRANFSRADLREADLSRADLTEANLFRADLREADLSGADLRGADLWLADLREANLRKANLEGARVTKERLQWAGNLEGAIVPDGSVHE